MGDTFKQRELLRVTCSQGETILHDILAVEEHQAQGEVTLALAVASPLRPQLVSESNSVLFYSLSKTACLLGVSRGTGFVINRLPSPHPSMIRWSAPCFVSVRLTSLGLSFGRRSVSSFTACMTKDVKQQLASSGKIGEAGFEIACSCGASLQDRAELIGGSCTGGMLGTVGVNKVSGGLVDFSFAGGSLRVDTAKNAQVYGSDTSVLAILEGKVPAPPEMQPLYSCLSTIVNHAQPPPCPSRVSASLERITAGFDPERRMVLDSGSVIKEAGSDPSHRGYRRDGEDQAPPAQTSSANGGGTGGGGNGAAGPSARAEQPGQVQVGEDELQLLRAAAAENAALKAQLESMKASQ